MSARLLVAALLLVTLLWQRPLPQQRRSQLPAHSTRPAGRRATRWSEPIRAGTPRRRHQRDVEAHGAGRDPARSLPRNARTGGAHELGRYVSQLSRRTAAAQEHALRGALPDAVDLLRLAVLAGSTPRSALAAVANHGEGPVADAFAEAQRRMHAGSGLAEELDRLGDLLGDLARPLLSILRSAALDGAPLAPALDRLADELRADRRRHAEAEARRLPVRMLFPLVCCALPALVLLAIVPLLVGTVRSLHL